jgi:hypothetical protein
LAKRQGGGSGIVWIVITGLGVALAALKLPLLLLLLGGLAPAAVAAVVDADPDKRAAITVGALTVGPMSGYLLDILTQPSGGWGVVRDAFAWLVIYGAAAVGWAVYTFVPVVVAFGLEQQATWRAHQLRKRQEALVAAWGPEVAGGKK